MLLNEAKWFGRRLNELPSADLFPMLNIGSHSADFRKLGQPWIDRQVFSRLRERGGDVVHTDIRAEEGVDVVGDLLDPRFRESLRARKFRSVMFCNVLEHVSDREGISKVVSEIVETAGLLFVSVPNRFPYHPDPIDTMFRPAVHELAALLPVTGIVDGEVVACGNLTTYTLARFLPQPIGFMRRAFQPTGRKSEFETAAPRGSKAALLPWLVRGFAITCIILRKLPAVPEQGTEENRLARCAS